MVFNTYTQNSNRKNRFALSIQQLFAALCAAETWHGLARHVHIPVVVAELHARRDVHEGEEGYPGQPHVVVAKHALLEDVRLARVVEEAAWARGEAGSCECGCLAVGTAVVARGSAGGTAWRGE